MHHHDHDDEDSHNKITPARLEAFSDGVLAIIITITVLELKVPHGDGFAALRPLLPQLITYLISFQIIGTYWNNHHHLMRATKHVSAGMMWANLHLLFWLSLIPFTAGWLGENHGSSTATTLYSTVLLLCAVAYSILQTQVVKHAERREQLLKELNRTPKGLASLICYAAAIPLAFLNPIFSDVLIVLVAIMWVTPDRRIERYL